MVELSAHEAQQRIEELVECLVDAVDSGASVSFLRPLPLADARAFWDRVIQSIDDGATILIGALLDNRLVGTVQLRLDTPQNQQHRGEIVKLLVHRRARGQGIGRGLMQQADKSAKLRGRRLLVLDTLAGSPASHLYESLGYVCAGVIPEYALLADGRMGSTAVYYKTVN